MALEQVVCVTPPVLRTNRHPHDALKRALKERRLRNIRSNALPGMGESGTTTIYFTFNVTG